MKSWIKVVAAFALSMLPFAAIAAGEVQLLKLQSVEQRYRNYWLSGRVEVNVANLAYAKQVAIRVKQQNGSWVDVPLTFNRAAQNGREIWSLDFNSNTPSMVNAADPLVFAVKYQVNGVTYWDNNNGGNYTYAKNTGTVLFGNTNVYLHNHQPSYYVGTYSTFSGSVTVKNLARDKQVKIVYSTDNWATTRTAYASYNSNFWYNAYASIPNPNYFGFEEWSFGINVGSAPYIDYAIVYTVNGVTYSDNNFGRNYRTQLQR